MKPFWNIVWNDSCSIILCELFAILTKHGTECVLKLKIMKTFLKIIWNDSLSTTWYHFFLVYWNLFRETECVGNDENVFKKSHETICVQQHINCYRFYRNTFHETKCVDSCSTTWYAMDCFFRFYQNVIDVISRISIM